MSRVKCRTVLRNSKIVTFSQWNISEAKDFLSPEECDYFVKMAKEEGLKESETVLNQPQNHRFVLRDHDGDRKLTVREVKYR